MFFQDTMIAWNEALLYQKNGISLTSRLILHVHKQILPLFRMILPTIGHQQFGHISVNNQMKQNKYMLCK